MKVGPLGDLYKANLNPSLFTPEWQYNIRKEGWINDSFLDAYVEYL